MISSQTGLTLTYEQVAGCVAKSTYMVAAWIDTGIIRLSNNVPVQVNNAGQLVYRFEAGQLTESAPIAWQIIDGKRVPVELAYSKFADAGAGFADCVVDPG
jgi:hypothetical protein